MTTYVSLPTSKRDLLPESRPAGHVDSSEIASLTVHVRHKGDMKELEQRVYEQSALPLSDRTYLTHDELADQFGSSAEDLDLVEKYAHQYDLTVVRRSDAEGSIVLRGRLGDLLSLFPADLQVYHHSTGTYRGRRGEIHVPTDLAEVVTGVFGYDTRPRHRAPHRQRMMAASGPNGSNGEPSTFFANRYKFPKSFQNAALDGSGQTIAIIELGGGFRSSDLKAFFHEINVPAPTVTSISVDHAGNLPSTADSADGEVMLDIEVAGAVAPKARIAVYFAPNNGDKGFLDAIAAAVNDTQRKPSVISISWGGPEQTNDAQGIQAFHNLFVRAAALGITICVASGDHGTADLDSSDWDKQIHVDHPAVDDMVLACGGTQINAQGQDVVWNDGTPFNVHTLGGGGWASGGGISTLFAVPSYQQDSHVPVSIATGKPGRGVPDIAMSATDYFTRVDSSEGPSGGTSAVAPLMAALVALLNQAKQSRVGFMNPFLYKNAANGVVNDVTSGTNAIKNTLKGYNAGTGWDACTGLGTPDGTAILSHL